MENIEKLKYYIIAGGFDSQIDLAKFLNISPARISEWKSTSKVPKKQIEKLEEEYGIIKEENGLISFIGGNHSNGITPTRISINAKDKTSQSSSISQIESSLLSNFKLLDKVDQKRIFEEIKKLADEKCDLSYLNEE